MQELVNQLNVMPVSKLNAIYNNAWRENHNDIDTEKNSMILSGIEFVCGLKNIEINGGGGSWQLKQGALA